MYPYEMSFDKRGVGYIDISNVSYPLISKEMVNLDYNTHEKKEMKKDFLLLPSSGDYLLKVNKDREKNNYAIYLLVEKLIKLQNNFRDIDFPIGVVENNLNVIGQIIRYYNNAKSIKNICIKEDLIDLLKYICLDEDEVKNLVLVLLEMLNMLERLFDNNISYMDVNGGNFVIWNNQIKLIDFESEYISFSKIRYNERVIIHNYIRTINELLKALGYSSYLNCTMDDETFQRVKPKVKALESNIRRHK